VTGAVSQDEFRNQNSTTACSFILLTTCHLRNDGVADLFGLIASEEATLRKSAIPRLRHIVLLQGSTSKQCDEVRKQLPNWAELISSEQTMSSPAARNVMIRHLLGREPFDHAAIVGFPDDDAWYPKGGLACVARHFRDPQLQLLLTRYGPFPSANQCADAFRPTLQQSLSRGACAAIFLRAGLLAELGGFHELLGLGTSLRGGEDTEFVHRAFHRARGQTLCVPGILVGHEAADPVKKATYYEGGLAAIMAHSRASVAARIALIRKLAVGVALVLTRRMSARHYLQSLRKAWANAPLVRSPERGPGTEGTGSQ
jgi:hypothetical protein